MSSKNKLSCILGYVLGGLVLAYCFYAISFSKTIAVSMVQLGRINIPNIVLGVPSNAAEQAEIQPTGVLIERLKSADFAKSVALRLKRPDLIEALTPWQNGGKGLLSSRFMRDSGIIEFRAALHERETALAIARAAAEELIDLQNTVAIPLKAAITKRLDDLLLLETEEEKRLLAFRAMLGELQSNETSLQDRAFMLSQYQTNFKNWEETRRLITAIELALIRAQVEQTQLIMPVHTIRSVLSSLTLVLIVGAVMGLMAGFIVIQFYLHFWVNTGLRTNHSQRQDDPFRISDLKAPL